MPLDTTTTREEAVGQTGPPAENPEPALAEVDMLVERADLGPGCSTLIRAGYPIPSFLHGLPYQPAVLLDGVYLPAPRRAKR